MKFQDISSENKTLFNKSVSHPLQSFEWGEFRQNSGVKVIRRGIIQKNKISNAYQLTIHTAPLGLKIGYLPKGGLPNRDMIGDLIFIGKQRGLVYILLEPNVANEQWSIVNGQPLGLKPSFHPLFTKYTFILDLTKSEEELLAQMHPKTRYNIKVAQKHEVRISEDNSDNAFDTYWRLTEETTKRQGFYAHDRNYHKKMWETIKPNGKWSMINDQLSGHLFIAKYKGEILTTWVVFVFKNTLYYPYGASSKNYPEVMANNLMMWEVIKWGKNNGLKKFDMWGSLSENPDTSDPWFGFHRFKKGYGGKLVEFAGSFDLVINQPIYMLAEMVDKLRWTYLDLKRKFHQ